LLGRWTAWPVAEARVPLLALSLAIGFVGLGASILHLGRPLYAFRVILGLGHSWLSREAVVLGLFAQLAAPFVILEILRPSIYATHPELGMFLRVATVVAGLAGVTCSIMVYHVVKRPLWNFRRAATAFYGTTIVLGLAAAAAVSAWFAGDAHGEKAFRMICTCLMFATATKLALEALALRHRHDSEWTPMRRSAVLLTGILANRAAFRLFLGFLGGVAIPAGLLSSGRSPSPWSAGSFAMLALILTTGGEIVERSLFFAAVVKPKMPGGLQP
jgi:DMSO reductase anchor subunit